MTDSPRARLEAAAEGLVYLSEGDAPFEFVELGAAGTLTPESFAALAGSPGAPVEEVPLDRFFAGHIEESDPGDPTAQSLVPRYRALRDALRETLSDVRVFRIGEMELRCYTVGRTPAGTIAGLVTTAWET
ncbi:MAG: nuclease A inhibitor family protein [Gemmatimonadetes bacterium]|nr:nuclease A inhibitor family protein [Gemmatimonadota bacterium]